jgi:hypothetical protein
MDCRSKGAISRTIADVARFTLSQSRHFHQVSRKKSAAFPQTVALSVSELVQRRRPSIELYQSCYWSWIPCTKPPFHPAPPPTTAGLGVTVWQPCNASSSVAKGGTRKMDLEDMQTLWRLRTPVECHRARGALGCPSPSSVDGYFDWKNSSACSWLRGPLEAPRSPRLASRFAIMPRGSAPRSTLRGSRSYPQVIFTGNCGSRHHCRSGRHI